MAEFENWNVTNYGKFESYDGGIWVLRFKEFYFLLFRFK